MEMIKLAAMLMCKIKSIIFNYFSRCFLTEKIICFFIHLKSNIQDYISEFIENAKNIEYAMERILNFLSLTTLIISNDLDQYTVWRIQKV